MISPAVKVELVKAFTYQKLQINGKEYKAKYTDQIPLAIDHREDSKTTVWSFPDPLNGKFTLFKDIGNFDRKEFGDDILKLTLVDLSNILEAEEFATAEI